MDPADDVDPSRGPEARTATSDRGAGTSDLPGPQPEPERQSPAGLITLTGDGWNGAPMLPSSWGDESPNKFV